MIENNYEDLKKYLELKSNERGYLLQKYYVDMQLSVTYLADLIGTYPNRILRDLRANGITVKTRSEAQKISIELGRSEHPSAGKTLDVEIRKKMSDTHSSRWDNMGEEEKKKISEVHKKNWDKIPKNKKEEMRSKAHAGMLKASKEGSRMEKYAAERFIQDGYQTLIHHDKMFGNDKFHYDLFLPSAGAVIEIDGPTHFKTIWTEEQRSKVEKADAYKNNMTIGNFDFFMIRIQQKKKITARYMRDLYEKAKIIIDDIMSGKIERVHENMLIYIE